MPKKLLDIQIAAHGKASGRWGTNIRMSLQSPFGLQTRWLWSIGLILQHQITVWVLQGYHLIIPKRFSGMAMNSLLCPTKTGPLRWDMVLCDKVLEPGQKHEKVARSIHWIHWKTEQHMPSICPATAFCNWSPYHQDSFGMVWFHIKKAERIWAPNNCPRSSDDLDTTCSQSRCASLQMQWQMQRQGPTYFLGV